MSIIAESYERVPAIDPTLWHKWNVLLLPVRCVDGGWTIGDVWRRKTKGGWQYQRRPLSEEESLENSAW